MVYTENGTYTAVRRRAPHHCRRSPPEAMTLPNRVFFLPHPVAGESVRQHASAPLPPVKTRFPLYRRLGVPEGRSGQVRNTSPTPAFDPRTVQPLASHSVQRYRALGTLKCHLVWTFNINTALIFYQCGLQCYILGFLAASVFRVETRNFFYIFQCIDV